MRRGEAINCGTFHVWATRLVNPRRGQDCPHGRWWEDRCWLGLPELAVQRIRDMQRRCGERRSFEVMRQDGRWCVRTWEDA